MNQTIAVVLNTLLLSLSLQTPQDILHLLDDELTTKLYLVQSTISTVLKASYGAPAFSCDTLLNIVLIVEWQTVTPNREALVDNTLLKSN